MPAGVVSARKAMPVRPAPQAHCAPVRDLVLDMAAENAVNSIYSYPVYYARGAAESGDAKSGEGGSTPSHTGTNNQETGIDEGDIVKTDGRYVYSIRDREVVIVRVWPTKSMRVLGSYRLPKNVNPSKLQLYGSRLVILSSIWEANDTPIAHSDAPVDSRRIMPYHPPSFAGTRITVLDVRNRARPRLISETDVEGWLSQSRMIGSDLYFVNNSSLRVPDAVAAAALARAKKLPAMDLHRYDWKKLEAARKKGLIVVRAYLKKKFYRMNTTAAMPRTRSKLARGQMSSFSPMYSCNALTVPGGNVARGIVNVSHLNVYRPNVVKSVGATGSGWQIYASKNAIYVASANWGEGKATTSILKFALRRGRRGPAYVGRGTVPGTLLNQFSMSEHNGFLRVMTTDQQWGRNGRVDGAANSLFVLRSSRRSLRIVGKVTGLAAGERIFSARMFGDKGYMVTFRQTDPLFTFDLSNPYRPKMVGELKINGFSSYIHPLDGDRLLTIGRDADDDGRVKGLHLQIFDVSNPATPVRTHQELIEGGRYSYSAAQWDHHAFTFDPVTGTLALPISGYLEGGYGHNNWYSGLEVFSVSNKGFDYRGFISHGDFANTQNRWNAQIRRSIIIGKTLLSVSNVAMMATSLKDPNTTLASVKLGAKPRRPRILRKATSVISRTPLMLNTTR